MKILLITILLFAFIGCVEENKLPPKHRTGEIVYLKPDSMKFVINDIWNNNPHIYFGFYVLKSGERKYTTFNASDFYQNNIEQ